jgi:hypothetical protein
MTGITNQATDAGHLGHLTSCHLRMTNTGHPVAFITSRGLASKFSSQDDRDLSSRRYSESLPPWMTDPRESSSLDDRDRSSSRRVSFPDDRSNDRDWSSRRLSSLDDRNRSSRGVSFLDDRSNDRGRSSRGLCSLDDRDRSSDQSSRGVSFLDD